MLAGKIMKRKFAILVCFIWPTLCFAGGDEVSGNVTGITVNEGKYIIHFIQTENAPDLFAGCKEIEVTVKYARVPWFSWLPLISSSHPSKKETEEAIEYMRNAQRSNRFISFGYMGYGLVPAGEKCSFNRKGSTNIASKVRHPSFPFMTKFDTANQGLQRFSPLRPETLRKLHNNTNFNHVLDFCMLWSYDLKNFEWTLLYG
jgi:hypothetical protein